MSWQWSNAAEGPLGNAPDARGYFHGYRLAGWHWRALAGVVDWLFLFAIPWGTLQPLSSKLAWVVSLSIAWWNSAWMASKTSQSLGKRIFGIRMVQVRFGPYNDPYVAFPNLIAATVRIPIHYFDFMLLGFLWPLINRSRGSLADIITRTVHYRDSRLPHPAHVRGPVDWL